MTSSGLMPALARTASLTLPGSEPYSPLSTARDSLVKVLYRSPMMMFITAWVPTIWLEGVTRGG